MRGTIGYLTPEWILWRLISAKAEVYNYGMVLFELISGRRNTKGYYEHGNSGSEVDAAGSSTFFPMWATGKVMEGEVGPMANLRLHGQVLEEELERACRVAVMVYP
ncbi:hypothetical protein QYE76_062351 [Lolium multiflorum]|uniref:Protein kinase domain-containing protein n=1 Tax=Lolium multiflorum TaxID=4521 RepID=A0AAD8S3Y8_LOLMU|nr:hypothetical protein QYE76_062351 [Lolium multiflorum]